MTRAQNHTPQNCRFQFWFLIIIIIIISSIYIAPFPNPKSLYRGRKKKVISEQKNDSAEKRGVF